MKTTELPAHIRDAYTIWVCQCCMLIEANGECCTEYAPMHADDKPCFEGAANCYEPHTYPVDGTAPVLHGGDGRKPLSQIGPDDGLAMGMGHEDHGTYCEVRKQGTWPDNYECNCETDTFSRAQCEGCGSYLHGERHAMTVFPGERKGETT